VGDGNCYRKRPQERQEKCNGEMGETREEEGNDEGKERKFEKPSKNQAVSNKRNVNCSIGIGGEGRG